MTDQDPDENVVERVMRSALPDETKRAIVMRLIAARQEHEQQISVMADQLIVEAEQALRKAGE